MKKLIAELPTLTTPAEKEELIVYLAAAGEAISAVLMTEREGKQMPVYFVSRTLQGPEINYTPMEKLVLALRPEDDSLATPIEVEEKLADPWTLFTDGSLCIDGSEAGLILINLEVMEFTYALRFRFDATNNEAKVLQYACWPKICGSQSLTNRIPLANHACKRKEVKAKTAYFASTEMIRECKDCQVHRPGPGQGQIKFLIIGSDYFTKWIEAKSVATITGNHIKKFVWDKIVYRFGLLGEIISNNGKQFRDNPLKGIGMVRFYALQSAFAPSSISKPMALVDKEQTEAWEDRRI
ncbi:reverse transcriptase domain-containing protein [Tanacetum coccineum]